MAERGSRAERRRERPQEAREPRGRQRWPKWMVATGTSLLLTVGIVGGGLVYHYVDQGTPYAISSTEGIPLVEQAIQAEGVAFDPQEKDLWDKAEQEKKSLPTNTLQATVDTRLNLLRKTMHASKNPFFNTTAQYFDDLIREGHLQPRILTTGEEHTVAETAVDVANGKLILYLHIPATTIRDGSLMDSALYLVHERRHMEDFSAIDSQNQNLSDTRRMDALTASRGTREKDLILEAPAYATQSRAFLLASALTGLDRNNSQQLRLAAHLLKNGDNHLSPKYLAYLVDRKYVD